MSKIKCNDCETFYIGHTGRKFKTVFSEHSCNGSGSALTVHLKKDKHKLGQITDNTRILHKALKEHSLNLFEDTEIFTHKNKAPDEMLNEQE